MTYSLTTLLAEFQLSDDTVATFNEEKIGLSQLRRRS